MVKNILRRWLTAAPHYRMATFAAMFGLVGLALIVASRAATGPSLGIEVESSASMQGTTSISDVAASGGSYIQFGSGGGSGTLASSVTQYGITWTFDKQYTTGQFANGDYWVVGPVKIIAMTPAFSGTRNGWQVNPASGEAQGLDDRLDGFQANLVPALPYTANAGMSIIKAVSHAAGCGLDNSHMPCLDTAAVLTVLGAVPANNGQNTFRPPYAGSTKPLFTTTQLQTGLLPSLAPVAGAPTLATVTRRFQRVQVDYANYWTGRYMHPAWNYTYHDNPSVASGASQDIWAYGSEIANDADEGALRLMLNESVSVKMPALINYVQYGIDVYGMHNSGVTWEADGGHMQGRKVAAVFAAMLLNDATMKSEISNAAYGTYGDDGHVYLTTNPSTVVAMSALGYQPALFGKVCSAGMYELRQSSGLTQGSADCRDPIAMIDGGDGPADGYQYCCTAMPMKGASLATRLIPGAKAVWNYDPFHAYVDRWVNYGAWATPDNWNSLGHMPARNFASRQGTAKDEGYYNSTFVDSMWAAYRGQAQ